MQTKAKIIVNGESDEVTIPSRPKDWSVYLNSNVTASEQFMDGVEDLPVDVNPQREAGS
jgi:hypothetical protein